jgi:hydroxypyruvate isomerase
MPKFSANLTMLFNEVEFLERFGRARQAGFKGVEYLFPYDWDKQMLAAKLSEHRLEQVLFNLPSGNWMAGERGIACFPDRVTEFQQGIGMAIEYAKALGCHQLNCLVGLTPTGVSPDRVLQVLVDNLRFAAISLEKESIRLLVEPLNKFDIPGFHLVHTKDAVELFKLVGHDNLWLQYDIYHMQIMEGDLTRTIRENLPRIAHIQLADNPGRHEPGTGEINYPYLFQAIDEMGYKGWLGCEYKPIGNTEDGLKWLKAYLR